MKKTLHISPYLLLLLSFLFIILLGTFLICLPVARTAHNWGNFIDAFFTATSATCVTGLCPYSQGVGNELTFFGQLVMLLMIQIGGLSFITVLAFFITLFSKLEFRDRYYLSQAVSSENVAHVGKYVRKIFLISLSIQFIGFLLGLPVFLSMVGKVPGRDYTANWAVWDSIFISASMFNNAGFDLFGGTSLVRGVGNIFIDAMPEWAYYYMCSYIMLLIIIGGISFLVIMEVFSFKKRPSQWRTLTKIILSTTGVLLVVGTGLFMLTDGMKPTNSITVFQALFQSVTCRTAGAATYDQNSLSIAGKMVSCILMLIGGSPLSTAGGIKTTTIFLIVVAMFCFLRGKKVTAFKRSYSQTMILKAMSLLIIAIVTILFSFVIIETLERHAGNAQAKPENIFLEIFSAFGTVGLSASLTTTLTVGSKVILCALMFIGRLGPMTLFQVFKQNFDVVQNNNFEYIEEEILIG